MNRNDGSGVEPVEARLPSAVSRLPPHPVHDRHPVPRARLQSKSRRRGRVYRYDRVLLLSRPSRRRGDVCHTSAVAACFGRVCRAPPGLPDFLRSNPEGVAHFAAALDDSSLHKVGKLIAEFQRAPPAPSVVVPPNFKVLTLVAMSTALPAVGFGFVDNFLMIIAGDYIDLTIGVTLGISTMAAAGLGNMVSDWGGIGLQGFIEQKLAGKVSYADQAVTGRAVDDTPLVSRLPVLCSFVVVVTSICPCGCLFGV